MVQAFCYHHGSFPRSFWKKRFIRSAIIFHLVTQRFSFSSTSFLLCSCRRSMWRLIALICVFFYSESPFSLENASLNSFYSCAICFNILFRLRTVSASPSNREMDIDATKGFSVGGSSWATLPPGQSSRAELVCAAPTWPLLRNRLPCALALQLLRLFSSLHHGSLMYHPPYYPPGRSPRFFWDGKTTFSWLADGMLLRQISFDSFDCWYSFTMDSQVSVEFGMEVWKNSSFRRYWSTANLRSIL